MWVGVSYCAHYTCVDLIHVKFILNITYELGRGYEFLIHIYLKKNENVFNFLKNKKLYLHANEIHGVNI